MNKIGISLGWNCYSAIYGSNNNIRTKKMMDTIPVHLMKWYQIIMEL